MLKIVQYTRISPLIWNGDGLSESEDKEEYQHESNTRSAQSVWIVFPFYSNPLTPRVKPWVIQSFLTFDFMERTLKCDHQGPRSEFSRGERH